MLQQTTVRAVIPYYQRFLEHFPTIADLAAASQDEVLALWSGLGYYSRARNLHACARAIVAPGGFPRTVAGLKALPGIGAYTAAAVAAIAFGVPVVPVDGNVERVTARVFAVETPLPAARRELATLAVTLNEGRAAQERPSDFAQALFDLGAGICTPRSPACVLCPWQDGCAARKAGIQADLPRRAPKADRPVRYGAHFFLTDATGRVLMRRRPEEGLLGGMLELPGTVWRDTPWSEADALEEAPFSERDAGARGKILWHHAGEINHVFTHFKLLLTVRAASIPAFPNLTPEDGFLVPPERIGREAVSSLMKKCLRAGTDFTDQST